MNWHQVVIRDTDVAEMSARSLIHHLAAQYRDLGLPQGVEVFHGRTESGDHVYFLSPSASALLGSNTAQFQATPLAAAPELQGYQAVNL